MKNWTSLVSLFTLLLVLPCKAQENTETLPIVKMLPYVEKAEQSIIEYTASLDSHSTLWNVLKATNLADVLAYTGEFTVFAPTNLAFDKLSHSTIDKLFDPKNKEALTSVLSYHIIAGKFSASSILRAMCRGNGIAKFTTIQGEKITASMRGIDIVLTDNLGNQAVIVTADSNQSNGIIHEIDTVFLPVTLF